MEGFFGAVHIAGLGGSEAGGRAGAVRGMSGAGAGCGDVGSGVV